MSNDDQHLVWEKLGSRYPDTGLPLMRARFDELRNPRTGEVSDRIVLESTDWVNCVAINTEGQIIMVKQYRFGVEYVTLETPGGMVDAGESPLETAKRELREETGYSGGEWRSLGSVEPNPAFHPHTCHYFLGTGVELRDDVELDAGEAIDVVHMTEAEVIQACNAGLIRHTLALSLLARVFPIFEPLRTSARVRQLVVEAVHAAATLTASDEVRDRWEEPSALDGMTVGALAAHLLRAAGATIAYLDRTPVDSVPTEGARTDGEPEAELLTPVTYFRAALEAPIHDRIKEVSADEAAAGHDQVAADLAALVDRLQERLATEPIDRLVGALGGRMLSLDDFCRTRLIEVLLHLDDLAVSVDVPRPETDPEGWSIVADISLGIARDRHGDDAIVRALARRERTTPGTNDAASLFDVFA